jgi:hypothetical protein
MLLSVRRYFQLPPSLSFKIAEIQEVLCREAVFGNVADFISCLNVANPQLSTELTTGRMEVCETFPFHSLDTDARCVARDRESHDTYGLEIVSFSSNLLRREIRVLLLGEYSIGDMSGSGGGHS